MELPIPAEPVTAAGMTKRIVVVEDQADVPELLTVPATRRWKAAMANLGCQGRSEEIRPHPHGNPDAYSRRHFKQNQKTGSNGGGQVFDFRIAQHVLRGTPSRKSSPFQRCNFQWTAEPASLALTRRWLGWHRVTVT